MDEFIDARGWLPLVLCGFVVLLSLRCFLEAWLQKRAGKPSVRRHVAIAVVLMLLAPLVYTPTFAAMPPILAIAFALLGLETNKNKMRPLLDGAALATIVAGVGMLALGYTISLSYGPSMWPASPRGWSLSLLEPNAYTSRTPARGDKVQMWVPKTFNGPNFDSDVEWPGGRYHKRIVGLPGDRLSIDKDGLVLNGKRIANCNERGAPMPLSRWLCHVSLPSDRGLVEYDISWGGPDWFWGDLDITIPQGKVFLIGDNMTESADSRDRGVVPMAWVVGRHM